MEGQFAEIDKIWPLHDMQLHENLHFKHPKYVTINTK